jgi:hypothetical protein
LEDVIPPTKLLEKFLKIWGEREKTRAQYISNGPTSSSDLKDPAGVALTLSRRLIAILGEKKIVNIEAGLVLIALGLAISSEVCYDDFIPSYPLNFFPEE